MYQKVNTNWYQESIPLSTSLLTKERNGYYFFKRVLDLVIVIPALFFLVPFFIIIALMIKFDSPGPVIFKQTRVGVKRSSLKGKTVWEPIEFTCYKFRTMTQNCDPSVHRKYVVEFVEGQVKPSKNNQAQYKLLNDFRVTRTGKILRNTSLDELPQLLNILLGEMSLVGPRPDVPYAVMYYKKWHHERLTALPGLTGFWQTKGRSKVAFNDMVQMDIEYIHNQSILLDLKLLILTIPAVLSRRGAV